MPYKIKSIGNGKVRVTTPNGVIAKSTTPQKARIQIGIIQKQPDEKSSVKSREHNH
jgi:hypothetical protein